MKKIMIVAMALASTVAFAEHHEAKDAHKGAAKHEECKDAKCKKEHKDHDGHKDHKDEHHDDKAHH